MDEAHEGHGKTGGQDAPLWGHADSYNVAVNASHNVIKKS